MKKPLSALAQSMVALAQSADSPYPSTPTAMEVTSALDKKYIVFLLEGMVTEVQTLRRFGSYWRFLFLTAVLGGVKLWIAGYKTLLETSCDLWFRRTETIVTGHRLCQDISILTGLQSRRMWCVWRAARVKFCLETGKKLLQRSAVKPNVLFKMEAGIPKSCCNCSVINHHAD